MSSRSLEVPRRPRPAERSRWWRVSAIVGVLALVVGWVLWYVRTPDELAITFRTATVSGVVAAPVYVGMFAAGDDFGRTLHVSEVVVSASDDDIAVTPLLCRGGTVGVTTDPAQFCDELIDPEGAELGGGDSILLEVSADAPTEVTIDRIEISFREGLRWGTEEAGLGSVTVTFADRPAPPVDGETESQFEPTERPDRDGDKDRKKKRSDRDKTAA